MRLVGPRLVTGPREGAPPARPPLDRGERCAGPYAAVWIREGAGRRGVASVQGRDGLGAVEVGGDAAEREVQRVLGAEPVLPPRQGLSGHAVEGEGDGEEERGEEEGDGELGHGEAGLRLERLRRPLPPAPQRALRPGLRPARGRPVTARRALPRRRGGLCRGSRYGALVPVHDLLREGEGTRVP